MFGLKKIFISSLLLPLSALANYNLTGEWRGNDGGEYYITQSGKDIVWYGESNYYNPNWSNVAHGTIDGNTIILKWSDVPKGNAKNNGILILEVQSNGYITAKKRTGGFGGFTWYRR